MIVWGGYLKFENYLALIRTGGGVIALGLEFPFKVNLLTYPTLLLNEMSCFNIFCLELDPAKGLLKAKSDIEWFFKTYIIANRQLE